ncbi:MAG: hypothetical protein ACI8ZM_003564 [Crocinitomix sp.]|jgi:hypothetical protein
MKNKLLYLLFATFIFASCSKEKKTENNLIGTWNAIVMTAEDDIDGTPLDLIAMGESMTLSFFECSAGGLCPITVVLSLDGDLETFETHYVVNVSGETMGIVITFEEGIKIIELTSDKLIISTPSFVHGNNLYVELDKV